MVTKTITVTEEAYNAIKGIKHEDESFSELLNRLAAGRRLLKVRDLIGVLGDSPEEAEAFAKRVRDLREKAGKDAGERMERVRARFERANRTD